MSRKYPILGVSATTSSPATVTVAGDVTGVFRGKHYRQIVAPHATTDYFDASDVPVSLPTGYQLIEACTFDVVGTGAVDGRYTTYTKTSLPTPIPSSSFSSPNSTIRVSENIATSVGAGGYITNVSNYSISLWPTGSLAVPQSVEILKGVNGDDYPIDYIGRAVKGYGESYAQNFQDLLQNFASTTAPSSPFEGQLWFNSSTDVLSVWTGSAWQAAGAGVGAPLDSLRVPFTASAGVPFQLTHNLAIPSPPFICHHSFFVDIGGGVYKPILPADVTYVNANRFDVTFSISYTGIALLRR